jgi:hypothetical protein
MRFVLIVFLLAAAAGCATSRPPASPPSASSQPVAGAPATAVSTEPLARQLARASETLHGKRYSGLLDFEGDSDALFVSAVSAAAADGSPARVDGGDHHTGKSSLRLAPGTSRLTIKLSSLLAGRDFPGDWTLLGLFVRADEATGLALSCADDGKVIAARKMSIPAGQWTAAMLDISALNQPPKGELTFEVRFDPPTFSDARVDDVMLIDNRETFVDASPQGWTVKRAGLRITCERKLRFNFGVVTADGSPQGWEVEEASDLRARFRSTGETKSLTVYTDGRSMWDGAYKPLSVEVRDDKSFAAAHASPAEVAIPEALGRLSRNTPGDADNDGYNEQLGAYQIQATGGRIELTLTPRSTAVPRPVLQIAGMPQGKALIAIEGRLVEKSTRLPGGDLLIELPARITRPTLVTVRIQ